MQNNSFITERSINVNSLSVFISWLSPAGRSVAPLKAGWRPGEVWPGGRAGGGRGASRSPSLLLSSALPDALPESDELLLLLICSITSASARSSVHGSVRGHTDVNALKSIYYCLFI